MIARVFTFLFKWRFLLAATVFAICVLFELHGSSIAMFGSYIQPDFPLDSGADPIIGWSRAIRSDEWDVFTPLALSQGFNDYAAINPIAEAWPTSMLTVYNQPVWDITVLAKPFYWGYLLLGSAKGLSWFWAGRTIALFLVTFEFVRLLTRGNGALAVVGAFMVTFSSLVQWWFAVNFLVEMLVAGLLAILMVHIFLTTESVWRKALASAIFALCGCAFVFSLYPAWMVLSFYIFLAVLIIVIARDWKSGERRLSELLFLLGAVLVMGAMIFYWYQTSATAIATIQNTVYPGIRLETGDRGASYLFNYLDDFLTPWLASNNPCEGAAFMGFFPMTELFALAVLFRRRGRDMTIILLLLVDLFFISFLVLGFPEWLARLTLMSQVTINRVSMGVGLCEVFLLLYLISVREETPSGGRIFDSVCVVAMAVAGVAAVIFGAGVVNPAFAPAFRTSVLYLVPLGCLMVALAVYLVFGRGKRLANTVAVSLIALSLLGGALVNPVSSGITAITERPLYSAVQGIEREQPGLWLADSGVTGNYLVAAGLPTVNSTNVIPAMERWQALDPSGRYRDVYNRYAHITVNFSLTQTTFELTFPDAFTLQLNMNDLKALGVDYLVVGEGTELPQTGWDGHLTLLYDEYGQRVYRVE